MDEKPERLLMLELHGEVAHLLVDPASVWVRAARDVLISLMRPDGVSNDGGQVAALIAVWVADA
jgi:hypothetical protein